MRVVLYLDADARATRCARTTGQVRVAVASEAAPQFAVWRVGADAGPARSMASGPDRLAEKLTTPKPAPRPTSPPRSRAGAARRHDRAAGARRRASAPAPRSSRRCDRADAGPHRARRAGRGHAPDAHRHPAGVRAAAALAAAAHHRHLPGLATSATCSRRSPPSPAARSSPAPQCRPAKVDAEIRDQPWDVALQAILASQGLAATEDANGIIIVDTQDRIAARAADRAARDARRAPELPARHRRSASSSASACCSASRPSGRAPSSPRGQPPAARRAAGAADRRRLRRRPARRRSSTRRAAAAATSAPTR